MKRGALHGLLDDIVKVVRAHVGEALDLHCPSKGASPRRVVLLQLGSSNDDQGNVDGEVWHRAKKVVSLWQSLSASNQVTILTSGGADPERFFNRTSKPHWHYVREVLLQLGLPEEQLERPGLEALHTVDEALLARELVIRLGQDLELLVITSAFHAKRARHLFQLALLDLQVELQVLPVPNASKGEKLQAYLLKEVETLRLLRRAPYGAWLEFLRSQPNAGALNENPQLCEPFFLSRQAAGSLRTAFREILRAKSRRCRRRLMAKEDSFDGSSSRSSSEAAEAVEAPSTKRLRLSE